MTIAISYKNSRRQTLSKARDGTVRSMGVSTTSIEIAQPFPGPTLSVDQDFLTNFECNFCRIPRYEEHPFVETIREGVLRYRLQSASHFDIPIEVDQIRCPDYAGKKLTPGLQIEVFFHEFNNRKFVRICRFTPRRTSRKRHQVTADDVQIRDYDRDVSLSEFLSVKFPILQEAVRAVTLCAWWNENGKTFDWIELPTELKERIIQFCMHRSHEPGNSRALRLRPRQPWRRKGPHEVTDQLGEWAPLLRVSHQVRAITLRLCFVGGTDLAFGKGLCIVARSYLEFADRIKRLGKYYQLLEPDSVPIEDKTREVAKTYKHFPRIYPQLEQYATLRHGVRRVHLQMSFLDYLHFFKVTAGGFEQYWRPTYVDYKVFEQLPHLNELIIMLPNAKGRLEDKSLQLSPPLFYDQDFACPRILHRLIYEQAAELLALYDNVKMDGFVDELEALRFKTLRDNAIKGIKFTRNDLEELYAEDQGGIKLEESVIPGVQAQETEEGQTLVAQNTDFVQKGFWPPKCRCAVRCRQLILGNQYGNS